MMVWQWFWGTLLSSSSLDPQLNIVWFWKNIRKGTLQMTSTLSFFFVEMLKPCNSQEKTNLLANGSFFLRYQNIMSTISNKYQNHIPITLTYGKILQTQHSISLNKIQWHIADSALYQFYENTNGFTDFLNDVN